MSHLIQAPPSRVSMREIELPRPQGRLLLHAYAPAEGYDLPVILYFHGGGFVGGSVAEATIPARFLAHHGPALVLCAAYALAPSRPFPAALEDAYFALAWAHAHAGELNGNGSQLMVAGHDAGGNLAACVAMMARDRLGPAISAQVLIAPMLDPGMTRWAQLNQSDVDAAQCGACYRQYLPKAADRAHPYAAPLESRRLAGLPPALVVTAGHDALHAEAELYAALLSQAGGQAEATRYAGVSHAALPSHAPALTEIALFLRRLSPSALPNS